MKAKSINEIFEEINNMPQETYPSNYITGDEFEEWLKSKKNDSISVNDEYVSFNITLNNSFSMQQSYKEISLEILIKYISKLVELNNDITNINKLCLKLEELSCSIKVEEPSKYEHCEINNISSSFDLIDNNYDDLDILIA